MPFTQRLLLAVQMPDGSYLSLATLFATQLSGLRAATYTSKMLQLSV